MIYSDAAIQVLLMFKAVFSLPYRSVEGLACPLMRLMGLELPVPDHTQMSRCASRDASQRTAGAYSPGSGLNGTENLWRRRVGRTAARGGQASYQAQGSFGGGRACQGCNRCQSPYSGLGRLII